MLTEWNSPYINHFISPDTIIPDPYNPQNINRYSYVTNNPLRYADPSGHMRVEEAGSRRGCSDPKYCQNGKPKPVKRQSNAGNHHPNSNTHLEEEHGGVHLAMMCPESPCKGGGGDEASPGGVGGNLQVEPETLPVESNIAGISTDEWTVENAANLGDPGRHFPNREISSGAVTAEENIDIAHQAVNQLTGPQSNILSERELPNGEGIIYDLRDGTHITWRPVASDASNFMPKIDINGPAGKVNLIFYPR